MLASVGRLILVAAPSCCGKTVFLAHLSRGAIPQIARAIEVENAADWRICDAVWLPEIQESHVERLVVAYAIPVHEILSGRLVAPASDARLRVVALAQHTTIVTLLAASSTLMSRLDERRRSNRRWILLGPRKYLRSKRRMDRIQSIYRDAGRLRAAYQWWFSYTASLPNTREWVVDANQAYTLKGRLKRTTSTRDRGIWIENAEANYTLHERGSWGEILGRMELTSGRRGG